MKQFYIAILSLVLTIQLVGCASATAFSNEKSSISAIPVATPSIPVPEIAEDNMITITLHVGEKEFSATLIDSEATQAFVKYLPMTVRMEDLNGQEKFYALPEDLPAASTERPPTIFSGDILCWSGNTLVLFYSTFQNSYGGYVRLGTVEHPDELAKALGDKTAEITWSLTE